MTQREAAGAPKSIAGGTSTEDLIRELLRRIGENPDREGLLRTPDRVRRSLGELTRGYGQEAASVVGGGIFREDCSEMVLVKDVEFYSLCEHHLLPFFGRVHVAYIPNGKIIGLSKIPRLVDVFARRLQVQERMTQQIAQALQDALDPKGVGVVAHAHHLCMMMRGVEKQNSAAMTSCLLGSFRDDPMTRNEFLGLVRSISR
jgi:GTP cyclohydrolase I